jgi:hypothetical protein
MQIPLNTRGQVPHAVFAVCVRCRISCIVRTLDTLRRTRVNSRTIRPGPLSPRTRIRTRRSCLPRCRSHSWRMRRRTAAMLPLRQGRLRRKPHQKSQPKPANDFQPLHLGTVVLLLLLVVRLIRWSCLLVRGNFIQRVELAQHVIVFQHVQILDYLKLLLLVLRCPS